MAPTTKTEPFTSPLTEEPERLLVQSTTSLDTVTPALGITSGDHCAVCGASMAADQRYCLACGERRGQARFTAASTLSAPRSSSGREAGHQGSRFSPGTTLIAGVATLLIALGVGVLIGRSGNSSPSPSSSKVQLVPYGPSTAVSTNGGGTSGATGATGGSSNTGHPSKGKASKSSSTGGSGSGGGGPVKTVQTKPPSTVKVGAKGHGAGYTHGKFTGNFFGP